MENELMLSIYVPTYNHEMFIAKALDSILMQNTRYKYEILVGEDCSIDGTRAILKEYEKDHPGVFKMFYRDKNMYKFTPNNSDDLKMRCKGKYLICLEGDDYWTDENKIERQISFLEEHPEYIAVAHKCIMVDKFGETIDKEYPQCQSNEYSVYHFLCDIMPGQTTTFMIRNYITNNVFDISLLFSGHGPGDRRLYFSAIAKGRIYCMNDIMSAYRYITNEGSSFSANKSKYLFEYCELYAKDFLLYSRKVCDKEIVKYMEMKYAREILKGLKMKSVTMKKARKYLNNIKYPLSVLLLLVKQQFYLKIMKKDLWLLR